MADRAVEFDLDSGISQRVESLVTKTILYIQNLKPCSPVFSEARSCADTTAYEHTLVYERFRIRKKRIRRTDHINQPKWIDQG